MLKYCSREGNDDSDLVVVAHLVLLGFLAQVWLTVIFKIGRWAQSLTKTAN